MEDTTMESRGDPLTPEIMEKVLVGGGNLADLTAPQRAEYYQAVCRSLGLNPLTQPFAYLTLNGKLRLYALRDCADQLRRLHGISIRIVNRERLRDIYIVTARATDRTGREDESTGAVTAGDDLKGEALANALMKAETKAKRRVTLSIAGLGWLDEIEVDSIAATLSAARTPLNHPDFDEADDGPPHPTADQVGQLVELAKACDVDLPTFGQQMRRLMDLDSDMKITKKFLRETMTLSQYEAAHQEYTARLKAMVEAEVVDGEEDDNPGADVPADGSGASLAEPSGTREYTSKHETPEAAPHQGDAADMPVNGPAEPQDERSSARLEPSAVATAVQAMAAALRGPTSDQDADADPNQTAPRALITQLTTWALEHELDPLYRELLKTYRRPLSRADLVDLRQRLETTLNDKESRKGVSMAE